MRKNLTFRLLRMTTKYGRIRKIFDYDKEEKHNLDRCPGCLSGNDRLHDFGDLDRYGYYAKTSWCDRCGLIFINPRMGLAGYSRFYQSGVYRQIIKFYADTPKKFSAEKEGIPPRVMPFKDLLSEYFQRHRKLSVLDIGGTGNIFHLLRELLSIDRYVCVNPAASEIEIDEQAGFEVFEGVVEQYEATEKFDLICMFGTLNHLLEPKLVFNKVSKLLDHAGIFAFDHVNRVEKMIKSSHPIQQIQIDHPVYPASETISYLAGDSRMKIYKMVSNIKSQYCYLLKLDGKIDERTSINKKIFEKLSKRSKSISLNYLIKYLVKRMLLA
ncbi:MAG: class I SAM-dependent methyltransferase [Deltaproteobacteria bacterium]|nr:class I SAM-dependent methyltransferase [Deltaproteobacteria bacterium]